jgi:hypothetical protein
MMMDVAALCRNYIAARALTGTSVYRIGSCCYKNCYNPTEVHLTNLL